MYTEQQYNNSLCHHGIKGQKWGIRRYQNPDGSYTNAGMSRYGYDGSRGGGEGGKPLNTKKSFSLRKKVNSLKDLREQKEASKIVDRMNRFSNIRKKTMSKGQKESYNKMKEYYISISKGKKPKEKRNIIQKYLDQERSKSVARRAAEDVATGLAIGTGIEFGKRYLARKAGFDYKINIAKVAKSSVTGIGMTYVTDEILNRVIKHY